MHHITMEQFESMPVPVEPVDELLAQLKVNTDRRRALECRAYESGCWRYVGGQVRWCQR